MIETPQAVLDFWREAGPKKWFSKDAAFDDAIRDRFLETHEAAAAGKIANWETTPDGALALIIALDQFPRNMFRGSARAFTGDPLARQVADRAIARGLDQQVPARERFFYLPYMHSERLDDQERSVALYRALGEAENLKYADDHADIIRKFGRFRIATQCSAAPPPPTNRRSLTAAGLPADRASTKRLRTFDVHTLDVARNPALNTGQSRRNTP